MEKYYLNNSYLKEFNATITSISGNEIMLDSTAFYPSSGGQPNDIGIIKTENKTYNVIDVKKSNEDDIIHVLENSEGLLINDHILGEIDWGRRYMYMRYHTALHIIDACSIKKYSGEISGDQIYYEKARIDFSIPNLDRVKVEELILEANNIVNEGHNVFPKNLLKEEALKIKDLARTEPGRELLKKLDNPRVIVIEDVDMQLDGGTHVKNTKEVGRIILTNYVNKGSLNKRIEIKLE